MQKIKVIFIACWGRNGSSILCNALGTQPDCYSVGELKYIIQRGANENRTCGCGSSFNQCAFWGGVINALGIEKNTLKDKRFIKNIDNYCHKRHFFLGLIKSWRIRKRKLISTDLQQYCDLYQQIGNASHCQVVVESSKNPMIARWLADEKSIDLYVVHLTRDPRASAYSHKTKTRQIDHYATPFLRQMGIFKSSYIWLVYNLGAWLLFKDSPNYFHLKYEDFCRAPSASINKVMDFINQSNSTNNHAVANQINIEMSHTVSGNPARFDYGRVTIKEDQKWLKNLSQVEKFLIGLITLPLIIKYNYKLIK